MSYKIFSIKSLIITFVMLVLGFLAYYFDFTLNFSPIDTVYFILIVFPLGVTIGQAEARRFKIMGFINLIKSQTISLALAYRDWIPKDNRKKDNLDIYKKELISFLSALVKYLGSENHGDLKKYVKQISAVEHSIGQLSRLNEKMRDGGVPANEVSRANQYLNKILDNFEVIRAYKSYNTSKLLINFLEYVLIVGCVILVPHFIQNGFVGVFVAPIIFISFSTLINIERILDNPLIRSNITDTIDLNFGDRFQKRITSIFED